MNEEIPASSFYIDGYTDNVGSASRNKALSKARLLQAVINVTSNRSCEKSPGGTWIWKSKSIVLMLHRKAGSVTEGWKCISEVLISLNRKMVNRTNDAGMIIL